MEQTLMSAPVVSRAAKPTTRKNDPRKGIVARLNKLQAVIAETVDNDGGDCVGRILEHAGHVVKRGTTALAEGRNEDWALLVEAEAFIKGAEALANAEAGNAPNGRAQIVSNIAADIDQLTNDVDALSGAVARGEVTLPAFPAASPETRAGSPVINKPRDLEAIRQDLRCAQGVIWMLIRCQGEISPDQKPEDGAIVECIQFIARVIYRVFDAVEGLENSEFHTALIDAKGIAGSLDAMTWADGMQLMGSDEVMCQLYDAIGSCLRDALAALDGKVAA